MTQERPEMTPDEQLEQAGQAEDGAPTRSGYMAPRALRPVIGLALLAGPAMFAHGVQTTGRWPEGIEWIQTVLLVPLISIGAGAMVVGAAFMVSVLTRLFRG